MKALLCRAFGPVEQLAVEDVPSPVPASNEVVVAVKAAGVNFPDVLIVQGRYQVKPDLPFAPGCEFSGLVKAVGAGVAQVRPGDAVIGLVPFGGFAEEALVDAASIIRVPAGIDFVAAAALMMAHGTALHALKDRARLVAGETLLVLGAAGGVGLAAVEIGRRLGATVIAAASTDAKLDVCRSHGAEETINYDREDIRGRIRALTAGRGVDVVFDPVGGPYAAPVLRGVAWNGRYLVVGFAAGEIPRVALNLPLLKGYSIVGAFWGEFMRREPAASAANVKLLLEWAASGEVKPRVCAVYPLSRAVEAMSALMRREVTGKVVVTP